MPRLHFNPLWRSSLSRIRNFVLIFYDILIYSSNWQDHLQHVRHVFQVLLDNQLYAKKSKCQFWVREMNYLGHILSYAGVAVNQGKVQVILHWPVLKNLKALREFLRLTGYYKRSIRGYSILAAPLTDLTMKNAFQWTGTTQQTFVNLKVALTSPPVLALPHFSIPFVIESDASATRIGAVLLHNHHPIAYISQELKNPDKVASAYERDDGNFVCYQEVKALSSGKGIHHQDRSNPSSIYWSKDSILKPNILDSLSCIATNLWWNTRRVGRM